MRNLFIALEGIDGSGKSTQARMLAEKLQEMGHNVHVTCEPTNGHVGSLLQRILKKELRADHRTIALLFAADRIEHLLDKQDGIIQKLKDGFTVVTDRYYFSSYAYNGAHSDLDWVIGVNKMAAQLVRPDVNIFVDVPPEICMQRINTNRATTELFENLGSLQHVQQKYQEAFQKLGDHEIIFATDGNRAAEEIAIDIWNKIEGLLSLKTK